MVKCVNILLNNEKHTVTSQAHISFSPAAPGEPGVVLPIWNLVLSCWHHCWRSAFVFANTQTCRGARRQTEFHRSCALDILFIILRHPSLLKLPRHNTLGLWLDWCSWCFYFFVCAFFPERSGGSQEHSWLPGLQCYCHGFEGCVGGFHTDGLLQGQVVQVVFKIQISFFFNLRCLNSSIL